MMKMKWTLIVSGCAIAILVMIGVRECGPGGDGVIGHLTLADGSEYLVEQKWNSNVGEPYTVSFYYRTNGGSWGWCYIDHEDMRWTRATLKYNHIKDSVEVFNGNELRAELFRSRHTFALYGSFNRELAAPQEWTPAYQPVK